MIILVHGLGTFLGKNSLKNENTKDNTAEISCVNAKNLISL